MKQIVRIALFTALTTTSATRAATYIGHDDAQLRQLQQGGQSPYYPTLANIQLQAEKQLAATPLSVTDKLVAPPSGDFNDYISLAIYWWPDPNSPDGLPYIFKDGQVNPEKDDSTLYDQKRMKTTVARVKQLALAYRLSGDERYADKAVALLYIWFIDPFTLMNPHLEHGQIVPGRHWGSPSGIIETVHFIALTDSFRMLAPSPSFATIDAQLKGWFSAYSTWLTTSAMGTKERASGSNHGVWYDAQVTALSQYTGRSDLTFQIATDAMAQRIALQIEPDGRMPRELARTKGKSYTAYNLEAFISLARAAEEVGVNLWDYRTADGRSLKGAIDWFIPYLLDELPWPYQQIIAYNPKEFLYPLHLANLHYNAPNLKRAIDVILAMP